MGYDLHITRADGWYESEEKPIRADEWRRYVEASADMEMCGSSEATTPEGDTLRMDDDGLAVWTRPDGSECWFLYGSGEITVKNPDDGVIERMKQVAAHFDARIQGDESEFY